MSGQDGADRDFDGLAGELECAFRAAFGALPPDRISPPDHASSPDGAAPPDLDFDALAARVLRHQYEHNPPYRAFCDGRGARPDELSDWWDSPAVPTTAFKHLDLVSAPREPEAVFRTSGTTAGPTTRGRHLVPSLSLYRASLTGPFRRHALGDPAPGRFVSLIPPARPVPESSLSYMITAVADAFASHVDWVVDTDGRLDMDALRAATDEASTAGQPVALLGTALAFVHLVERIGDRPLTPLVAGSRVMETGGFKGMARQVSRTELHETISTATGVPSECIVNEYGMTELLSQLYEPVLSEGLSAAGTHVPPPWLRARALDPTSLTPVPEGAEGILAFFDLANLGSVSHVLTQDVGSVRGGRIRLRGRLEGAEPRGCSRAMDELMTAARTTS